MRVDFSAGKAAKERSYYTLISYAAGIAEDVEGAAWDSDDGHVVPYDPDTDSRSPTPDDERTLLGYEDLTGMALPVDLDLPTRYKCNPMPEDARDAIESRLKVWFDHFESLAGTHWTALHPSCGAYLMIPPAVIRPIVTEFEEDEKRALVLEELAKRFRQWCSRVDENVKSADDYPDDLLDADLVAHKNRQYKTVGSVHSSLDSVVHPLNRNDPEFSHLEVDDVDEENLERFDRWADRFTDDDHEEAFEPVIWTLWETDTPMETLHEWAEEQQRAREEQRQRARERTSFDTERLRNMGITTDIQHVYAAVESVDVFQLAERLASSNGQRDGDEMDFDPWWRVSDSGRGATVLNGDSFLEKNDGTRFDAAKAVALDHGIINEPSDSLSGEDWIDSLHV